MYRRNPELQRGRRLAASALLLALACTACSKPAASEVATRGHDPWVLRATLDERPRMLLLALRPDLWVAYDTQRAALYRASHTPINLDGAVYNAHHGPQPTSRGAPAVESAFPEPWHVMRGRDDLRPAVRYLGHRFEGERVVLSYQLSIAGGPSFRVEESPEAARDGDGRPALERVFRIADALPTGLEVELDFNAPALGSRADVTLTAQDKELSGRLKLRRGSDTRLIMQFAAPVPARASPRDEPRGQTLIAENDCATCHNPTAQAAGPSYKQIAEHYRTNVHTIAGLAAKIMEGGADEWGDAAMVAHPGLDPSDAKIIAEYILTTYDPGDALGTEATHRLSAEASSGPNFDPAKVVPGLAVQVFELGHPPPALPLLDPQTQPSDTFLAQGATLDGARGDLQRRHPSPGVAVRVQGWLQIEREGDYDLRIDHDGMVELRIGEVSVLRDADASARRLSPWVSARLKPGFHAFDLLYASASREPHIALRWQPPDGKEAPIPAQRLFARPIDAAAVAAGDRPYTLVPGADGDGRPLGRVHPSFSLRPARPHGFKPKVGGMDVLPDGRLAVTTWDARGAVYVLDTRAGDPEEIDVRMIAQGLNEPLGLKVVDGEIYVLQKHELTKLVDTDRDGVIDGYRTVSDGWGATGNFHEFAFGLAYRAGHFYATLATAVDAGGTASKIQKPDRGSVMRIARDSGAVEIVARGLRTPNGIGIGADDQLFVTDNEGDWLPANKLVHVVEGAFYGSFTVNPDALRTLPIQAPVVWLPVDEIAYSPSQPLRLDLGPYRDQMLYGDVTYGGLQRVVLQKVAGQYQGCVLPFTQGLEAGINRAVNAPDGSIYVGGIGNPADWAQEGKLWYGLQRLSYSGAPTFELLDVQLRSDGVALTFTEPLRAGDGDEAADYMLKQWTYVPTAEYGGPKVDERPVAVQSVHVSPDRRSVLLATEGVRAGHVLHVKLARPPIARSDREIWATDAWCTVNAIPTDSPGDRFGDAGVAVANRLTPAELADGWRLLFDGKSLRGWRAHRGGSAAASWQVRNGVLSTAGARGDDLVTLAEFDDFELDFEWKVTPGGNSGVFYRATEAQPELWRSSVEMQLLDDAGHADREVPTHRAGSAYDLFAPRLAVARPAGEYNQARIVARGTHVEHWLNGHKIVEYDTASSAWKAQLARSKFADLPALGEDQRGRIGLQHHGQAASFRNIKLRPLRASEATAGTRVTERAVAAPASAAALTL